MSDLVLSYLIERLAAFGLPAVIFILAGWRVARLRSLTHETYRDRVDASLADTLKERLSEQVVTPLFNNNNVVLPPDKTCYDIVDLVVPDDSVDLLAQMYLELSQQGKKVKLLPGQRSNTLYSHDQKGCFPDPHLERLVRVQFVTRPWSYRREYSSNLREGWFVAPDLNVEGQGRPTRLLTVGDLFPRAPFFSVFQMLSMWYKTVPPGISLKVGISELSNQRRVRRRS
ncbi:hypothetical protein ACFE04_011459 [Oxalis oulophora]